jgi:hypothetical protein
VTGALLAAELDRFLSRRLVRVFVALFVVAFAVTGLAVFLDSGEEPGFRVTELTDVLEGTSVSLALVAWVVAASFIGAEWHHGSLATTLTWEPRRVRLLVAKAAACSAVVALTTLLLQALLVAALLPAALARGTTVGADRAWAAELAATGIRVAVLAGLIAVVGFSLAAIAQNTAASLAAGFFWFYFVEQVLGFLRPGTRPWLLGVNAERLVLGSTSDALAVDGRASALAAGLLLVAYAGLVFAAALALFQRRDVT